MRRLPGSSRQCLPLAVLLLPALQGCTGVVTHAPKIADTLPLAESRVKEGMPAKTMGSKELPDSSTLAPTGSAPPATLFPRSDEPDATASDLPPQQAAQAAATDVSPWRPLGRLLKFMGRKPSENVFLWRSNADVSLPGPDLANFPNSSYTLPRGGVYLESSPVGFYGVSAISSSQWNWEYLLRYGLTDNLEFRLFSNGLTAVPGATGFSPLAFDTKAHLWAADWDWFNVSVGAEAYIQTTSWLASPALYSPLQYAFNLLVDHDLPWGVSFEWNLGFVRQTNPTRTLYLPTFQWAFQRNITDDIALFVQGYHNADALPRVPGARPSLAPSYPQQEAVGLGGQWSVNKQIAFFGSYNWGLTRFTPAYNANLGVALSF